VLNGKALLVACCVCDRIDLFFGDGVVAVRKMRTDGVVFLGPKIRDQIFFPS